MTYHAYWYKAFSVSCVVHLVIILLLAILLQQIDSREAPEQFISIELAETGGDSSQVRQAREEAAFPVTRTAPVKAGPEQAAVRMPVRSSVSVPEAGQKTAGGEIAAPALPGGGAVDGGGEESAVQAAAGAGQQSAAGVEAADGPDIDGIINAFLLQIEKRKDYPYIARRRGQEGTVTVAVRLTAAGQLAGAHVTRSSGVAALDEAALALVRRVCPFPHQAGRAIAMNIPITYQLE